MLETAFLWALSMLPSEPEIMWSFYSKDNSQSTARNSHTKMDTPKYYCLSMASDKNIK